MIKPKLGLKDITNNTDNSIQKKINNFKDPYQKDNKERKKLTNIVISTDIKLNKLLEASSHKSLFTLNFPDNYFITKVDRMNKDNPQTVFEYLSSIHQEYILVAGIQILLIMLLLL